MHTFLLVLSEYGKELMVINQKNQISPSLRYFDIYKIKIGLIED